MKIKFTEGALASRDSARAYRERIKEVIAKHPEEEIELNLGGVLSMTEGFADELLGVLVLQLGLDPLLKRLRIENANVHTLHNIAVVIKRRSKQLILEPSLLAG